MLNPCSENWARAQGRKPWRKLPNAVAMRRSRCDEIGLPLNLSNPRAHIRTRLPRTLADEIVGIAGALETSHCFREFVEGGLNLVGTPGKFRLESLAPPLYRPLDRRSEECRGRHTPRKPGIFRPDQIEHQWRVLALRQHPAAALISALHGPPLLRES